MQRLLILCLDIPTPCSLLSVTLIQATGYPFKLLDMSAYGPMWLSNLIVGFGACCRRLQGRIYLGQPLGVSGTLSRPCALTILWILAYFFVFPPCEFRIFPIISLCGNFLGALDRLQLALTQTWKRWRAAPIDGRCLPCHAIRVRWPCGPSWFSVSLYAIQHGQPGSNPLILVGGSRELDAPRTSSGYLIRKEFFFWSYRRVTAPIPQTWPL